MEDPTSAAHSAPAAATSVAARIHSQLYKTGYRDIIPVVRGEKRPAIDSWTTHRTSAEDAARWDASGMSVGLRTAHFPVVDIDTDDEGVACLVIRIADAHLGEAPVRVSRPGSRALLFRTDEPFAKRVLSFATPDRKRHQVEVLGQGQQCVIWGPHPSGHRYRWDPARMITLPDQLPLVTIADIEAFLDTLARHLEAVHCSEERGQRYGCRAGSRKAIGVRCCAWEHGRGANRLGGRSVRRA